MRAPNDQQIIFPQELEELQQLVLKEYHVSLPPQQLLDFGMYLINLHKPITKPIDNDDAR
jgi:hypothetical protein